MMALKNMSKKDDGRGYWYMLRIDNITFEDFYYGKKEDYMSHVDSVIDSRNTISGYFKVWSDCKKSALEYYQDLRKECAKNTKWIATTRRETVEQ